MSIQSVRGMPDILPEQAAVWCYLEKKVSEVFSSYGLKQIRTPIVEETRLFARSIGDTTDIVEKEMYIFEDRNGDSLALRPELTAGIVRSAIENGLLHNQSQRLWYQGPAFRYERPQKGRYRQFHQIGVECFGIANAMMDAELIEITNRLWCELGISDHVVLNLNSIGSVEARVDYRKSLIAYLTNHYQALDSVSQTRFRKNPLRIFDSKDAATQALLVNAPVLNDYLTAGDRAHFQALCDELDSAGIKYVINQHLVRGLDYYDRTVFEWITESLGAQGTICGGGRYDGLVEHLGGKSNPAVGFALGVERVVMLMQALDVIPHSVQAQADIYLMTQKEDQESAIRQLAREIRMRRCDLRVMTHIGGGSLKSQIKKANKFGARIGLIIGEAEMVDETVTVKPLQGGDQRTVKIDKLFELLMDLKED